MASENVLTYLPSQITANYSVSFRRTITAYPAGDYSLKYDLRLANGGGSVITITSSDNGSDHQFDLTATTTSAWNAGDYEVIGYVVDDATGGTTTKEIVETAQLTVLADPKAGAPGDLRSFNRKTRDLLRSTYQSMVTGENSSVSVNGKTFTKRTLEDLRKELAYYESMVAQEERTAQIAAGRTGSGMIHIQFNRPS